MRSNTEHVIDALRTNETIWHGTDNFLQRRTCSTVSRRVRDTPRTHVWYRRV